MYPSHASNVEDPEDDTYTDGDRYPMAVALDRDDDVWTEGPTMSAAPLTCRACGCAAGNLPIGTTWRVCRCTSVYCQWCLDLGCLDCPAVAFWQVDDGDAGSDYEPWYDAAGEATQHYAPGGKTGGPPAEFDVVPCLISPEAAHKKRLEQLDLHNRRLADRRAEPRRQRKEMQRDGRRPRRERSYKGKVTVTSANVNCADRLLQELQWGRCFCRADFLAIQELRARRGGGPHRG